MIRSLIVDTGPLYAAVDPDDSYYERARQELKKLTRERYSVIVCYPTLLETYSLLLHRLGTRTATLWLEEIISGTTLVNPSPEDYLHAISKVATLPDQKVTLFDAVVAVLAGRLKAEVWTYDHHFDVMRCSIWR